MANRREFVRLTTAAAAFSVLPRSARATSLTASDIHAHNSFAEPQALVPKDTPAAAPQGGALAHRFPPASVTRLTLGLQ